VTGLRNKESITQEQRRAYPGGAALKILKRRTATVKQIGKITGTMKVVASSKLPGALVKASRVSPFYESMESGFSHMIAKLREDADNKSVLTIIIYTDKGLCGSTNNQISRMLDKESMSNQKVVVWGEKGASAFEKSKHSAKVLFSAHPPIKNNLTFTEISAVVSEILKEEFDMIRIIYNKMAGSHSADIKELWLPSLTALDSDDAKTFLAPYELESVAADELLESLNEYQLCAALNYVHYHNQAVELFQRRNSMENASKNAGEVSKKLTLLFNKARQAAITTELGEICSGAAAVDEMLKAGK
jgi:ATP synthase F1 gamma subunit